MSNYKNIQPTNFLTPTIWATVNCRLVVKSIRELLHEVTLKPTLLKTEGNIQFFELATDLENIKYRFSGIKGQLDHWYIHPDSLEKIVDNKTVEFIDAAAFYLEFKKAFGTQDATLTRFIEEISNTLFADAFIEYRGRKTADELADADYQTIEHEMDGHPWATVNKGRLDFNYKDYFEYVPEVGPTLKLWWVAAHKTRATYSYIWNLEYQQVIQEELGANKYEAFCKQLTGFGLDPADYFFIPTHLWQWENKLIQQFAQDIALQNLVPLGFGEDHYQPQQSIRTLFNIDRPKRFYVKTAISILNTSTFRGLCPKQIQQAPPVSKWIKEKIDIDPIIQRANFSLLGEVATLGYHHPHFSQIEGAPYQYPQMLGVIWRESAYQYLAEGETAMTMAALMHLDGQGKPLLQALVKKSGKTTQQWVQAYLDAYLQPILHCFFQHDVVFSPHGENTILKMKNYTPVGCMIKDLVVEDVHLTKRGYDKLPKEIQKIMMVFPDDMIILYILSGVFVGVFRYIAQILNIHMGYDEDKFWEQVAQTIQNYQEQHPELRGKFKDFNLFQPTIHRVCLNRTRLISHGYKEEIPLPDFQGMLANPIHVFQLIHSN